MADVSDTIPVAGDGHAEPDASGRWEVPAFPAPRAGPSSTEAMHEAVKPASGHRFRRVVSMVLVVLVAVLVPVGMVAVWATRTVLNTDRFTTTVSDVTSNPAVLSALSTRIADEAFDAVNGSAVLSQLPPALQGAVPIIEGALHGRVEQRVNDVLSSDAGQTLLTEAVQKAHAGAMSLLQSDGLLSTNALTVRNGAVTLDVRPLIRQTLAGLQNDGVIPASVAIPAEGDPPGKLATALGTTLPDNFGQIVVYQTDAASVNTTLDQAQRLLVLTKRGVVLLVIIALALAVAAVLVAVDRRRALYRVGLGVAIGGVILLVVARRVAAAVPSAATTPAGRAVAGALADALRSSLTRALVVLVVFAAVVAVLARAGRALFLWAGAHDDVARIIVIALGLFLLVLLGLGWGAVTVAVIVAGGGLIAVHYATRSQARPEPAQRAI
jgi:hypothetical protein